MDIASAIVALAEKGIHCCKTTFIEFRHDRAFRKSTHKMILLDYSVRAGYRTTMTLEMTVDTDIDTADTTRTEGEG